MKGLRQAGGRIWKDIRTWWKFGAVFLLYDILANAWFGAFCPSVIVAGLPCPGCGMTRSVIYFALGRFAQGWQMNPLGILWLALALYFCVMRYGFGKKPKGLLPFCYAIIALMILVYLYRMYRYFPGEPPLCYTSGNLLERVFPGYEDGVQDFLKRLCLQLKV